MATPTTVERSIKFDALVMVAGLFYEKEKEKEMERRLILKETTVAPVGMGNSVSKGSFVSAEHGLEKGKEAIVPGVPESWQRKGSKRERGNVVICSQNPKRRRNDGNILSGNNKEKEKVSKCKTLPLPLFTEVLPLVFKLKIAEMMGTAVQNIDPILLIEKRLTNSDIETCKSRLSMPTGQLRDSNFLRAAERNMVGKGRAGLEVTIIQPNLATCEMNFQLWPTGESLQYVFKTKWNDVKKSNDLKFNDLVQIWYFRKHEELSFAIVKVDE